MRRALGQALSVLTGFSAGVYTVSLERAFAARLDSQDEVTSAVLGIFVVGLFVGYWIFGRVNRGWNWIAVDLGSRPLVVYAATRNTLSVLVLVSSWLLEVMLPVSASSPARSAGLGFAQAILLASVLIGPVAMLMGSMIRMLARVLSHDAEDAAQLRTRVHGLSAIGALAGAMVTGLALVPLLGSFKAVIAMGAIDISIGVCLEWLGIRRGAKSAKDPRK